MSDWFGPGSGPGGNQPPEDPGLRGGGVPDHFDDVVVPVPWYVQWRPAMIAALVLATVVGVTLTVRAESGTVATTTTTTTIPAGTCPEGAPVTCYPLTRVIEDGDRGEDVKRLQMRLKELLFDPGRIDGIYGGDTMMAVWAFQTLVMKRTRDTVVDFVTSSMWDAMRGNVVVTPRRQPGSPRHVEIYLPEQAMALFEGPRLLLVSHISSGHGRTWCEEVTIDPGEEGNETGTEPIKEGICGDAVTPGGIYYFYNRRLGLRESKLGTMWNPVYFNYGIAIHGAQQVPKWPASHGCVRIPIFISDYFPAMVRYNDRVYVFDGVKEPEEYGSPPPPFDRKDPNYTTTTSSTTTTSVPRTTVPKTTVPKTTVPKTTVPPSTTTTTTVVG